ncbi:magnesium transporter [Salipiger bermudensis]|uniref:magnesium transporter n=1 Tax=Salipiger bermudensis TaxID=344736 RepID=UPI001C9994F9|nr:magnesium transporter [Salipiger bermudensis]MBY6002567.1 magnesium transporter [Salipiger bermudensis]
MTATELTPDTLSPFDPIDAVLAPAPLLVSPDMTCAQTIRHFAQSTREGTELLAFVVDADQRFLGVVRFAECGKAAPGTRIRDVLRPARLHADLSWSAEEAAQTVVDEELSGLAVLDAEGRFAGAVSVLGAHRYLLDKIDDDTDIFAKLTGDYDEEYFDLPVWHDFRRRIPWVLGLAIVGLAAGYVVHVYESALDALVILALYMPMVADTGGNVGTQSASLVTRAISYGEVELRDAARILWRETRVALMLAGVLFLFAWLKVLFLSNGGDVPAGMSLNQIGLVIAIAISAQVVSATLIGAILPVAAVALRQDPAVVSGPALTTIVDLTGLLLYFGITTWLLAI